MTVAAAVLAVLVALAGAAAGSFAALAAERLTRGEAVALGRSRCQRCGTVLRVRDLVPLLSWPALRGRCATCGARIPAILWHAEIAGAALAVAALFVAPDPARALLLALWSWALLALALADLRRYRLPDPLVTAAALTGLALALAGDGSGWPALSQRLGDALVGAAGGGLAFWAIRGAYRWRTGRDGMGLGDVRLAAALGLATGPERLPLVVLTAALGALVLAMLRAHRRRRPLSRLGRVPFGAALAMAAAVWMLLWTAGGGLS